jgi:hypothetical protein
MQSIERVPDVLECVNPPDSFAFTTDTIADLCCHTASIERRQENRILLVSLYLLQQDMIAKTEEPTRKLQA